MELTDLERSALIEFLEQVREKPRLFNSRDESEQSLSQ